MLLVGESFLIRVPPHDGLAPHKLVPIRSLPFPYCALLSAALLGLCVGPLLREARSRGVANLGCLDSVFAFRGQLG